MKQILGKIPYIIFIALSLITLLQIIIIFKDSYSTNGEIIFESYPESYNLNQPSNSKTEANNTLININTADIASLESLPGIGEVSAKKIIENRPYINIEQVISKAGITQSTYSKIQLLITI